MCSAFMQTALRADYFFDNLFVVAPNGDLSCSGIPLRAPLNVSSRQYFQRAVNTKKFAIGDFQITRDRQVPVIIFALPILDSTGNVTAVVGAAAKLIWFQDAFSKAVKNTAAGAVAASAIDESGIVLASAPNNHYAGQPARGWNSTIKEKAQSVPDLHVQTETWRSGVVRTTAYLPIYRSTSANIYLRVGLQQEEAFAAVIQDTEQHLALLAAFAVTVALAAWSLSSWLVIKPIRRLKETATLLGSGKLDARTGVRKLDGEIGELALQFDTMAERVEAQHNALAQLTRLHALRGEVNAAVLRAKDEVTLLNDVCQIVRKIDEFEFAWAGYVERDKPSRLVRRAWSAADPDIEKTVISVEWAANTVENDPVYVAIRSGRVCVIRDIDDPQLDPDWRNAVARLGCRATVGLPIVAANEVIGGFGIYCTDVNAFGDAQIQMLVETANDLGFGIGALRADHRLRQNKELLRMIVDNIPTMIFVKDAKDLRFVSMNRAGEELTGVKESEFVGKTDFDLFSKEQAEYFQGKDRQALIEEKEIIVTDELISTANGDIRIVETKKLRLLAKDGTPKYLLGISEDITDRREAERRLNHIAKHDYLTGLMNRHGLLMQFQEDWLEARAGTRSLTLLYIDLDGFKEINDTLGHSIGDELLKSVSYLLGQAAQEGSRVARVGGDEFIILLRETHTSDEALALAEYIRKRCERSFHVEGHEIYISASIGVSAYPGPVGSYEELLRTADIAMYAAKAQGRNRYALYTPDMQAGAVKRVEMRNYLRHAIEYNELHIHYQPRVSMLSGRIVGAEALLRWDCAQLGSVPPAEFIPLAEESGLINEIGEWVLRHACLQAQIWKKLYNGPFQIAVNLSPRQLRQTNFIEIVSEVLGKTGLQGESLELEITESAIMDRGTQSIDILNEISALGIRLAVDDFGTGYSNLAYLKKLPVDVLKIDQSFVRGVTNGGSDLALVTAIVAMAQSLSLSVTAEGIETDGQRDIMRGLGVSAYQGYLFSRPVSAEQFSALLALQDFQNQPPKV